MTIARNHHKGFILQNTVIVIQQDTVLYNPNKIVPESLLSKAYNLEGKVTPEYKLTCDGSDQGRILGKGISLAGII